MRPPSAVTGRRLIRRSGATASSGAIPAGLAPTPTGKAVELWVGKAAADNDELCKLAKSNDYWLHAIGVTGSRRAARKAQKLEKFGATGEKGSISTKSLLQAAHHNEVLVAKAENFRHSTAARAENANTVGVVHVEHEAEVAAKLIEKSEVGRMALGSVNSIDEKSAAFSFLARENPAQRRRVAYVHAHHTSSAPGGGLSGSL